MRVCFYFRVVEGGHLEEQLTMTCFHNLHDQCIVLGSLN